MHILLIEPWFAGSHRAWAEGLARHSRHQVELINLPGESWRWRLHGAAPALAAMTEQHLAGRGRPDVVVASDMMNLAAYLGLTRAVLGPIPVALYMHENQITYPRPAGADADPAPGLVNWVSLLAADRIYFNSVFHRDVVFEELPKLLAPWPDSGSGNLAQIATRTAVLPVGVDLARLDGAVPLPVSTDNPPVVLWNHRWEPDKHPEPFLRTLIALAEEGLEFRVILAGEGRYADLEELRRRLLPLAIHDGFADEELYARLLRTADIVISTARQEFFGVSIVEAVYAGAWPILPHRLAYPELLPTSYHHSCLYRGNRSLAQALRWALTNIDETRRRAGQLAPHMARFDWRTLSRRYDSELEGVAGLV